MEGQSGVSWFILGGCNLGGAAVKRSCLLLAPILLTTSLWAQTKNPVASVMNEILPRQQKNIVAAVEEMPVDKFSYEPTPEQMTFARLVLHIIESNTYLCAKVSDTPAPKGEELKESDSKEKLVGALKASFDCSEGGRLRGPLRSSHLPVAGLTTTAPRLSISALMAWCRQQHRRSSTLEQL
jgi:hypothetical protein